MAAAASFQHNNPRGPHGGHVGGPPGMPMHGGSNPGSAQSQNFLPLENLNLAMGGMALNSNGQPPTQVSSSSQAPGGAPPQISPSQQGQSGSTAKSPQLPMNVDGSRVPGNPGPPGTNGAPPPPGPPGTGTPPSTTSSGNQNGSGGGGFVPFQPRSHQPVTYTAGTFAQTKFGSTKLKSNAKKTNRMSPTEFSNYIKQRAMQKQGSIGGTNNSNNTNNGSGLMPIGKVSIQ